MRRTVAVVLVVALVAVPMGAAAAQTVFGQPRLSVSSPDATVTASSVDSITVSVTNDGDVLQGGRPTYEEEVKTARDLQVTVLEDEIDTPITVKTGTQTIASLPSGQTARPQFQLEVGDAEPGTYRVPVELEYTHTRAISYGQNERTERTIDTGDGSTEYITVTVEDEPQFEIIEESDDRIVAGDTGDLEFTVKNVGTREATDATVSLSTKAPGVFFGTLSNPAENTAVRVPPMDVNETATVSVTVGASGDVSPGSYPIEAQVQYDDDKGITAQSDPLQTGLEVTDEQSFSLQNVTTTDFRVDEPEARIEAEVVNDGPATAHNVVVRLNRHEMLTVTDGESAVGDLKPDESAAVSFTARIPEQAEAGSNSLTFDVQYENDDGDLREAPNPLRKAVSVGEERDRFTVVGVNTAVTPGGSDELAVDLRYDGDKPAENVNAKLFTSDPLSSADDGAHLGTVEPGETVTATFRVSAGGEALAKSYSSSVEVRYDEPDGDTRFTGSLSIGVPVSESESGGVPVLPAAAGAGVALVGGGLFVYRRV